MRWLVVHPGPSWSVADVHNGWTEALRDLGEQVETYDLDVRIKAFDAALVEATPPDGNRMIVRKMHTPLEALSLATENIWAVAFRWWPQVVVFVSAMFIPAWVMDGLRRRGMTVVLLHTESPYQDVEQLERHCHADLSLVNDPLHLDSYTQIAPAYYQPHCYRPKIHYPGHGGSDYDFVFAGTGFPSRQEFFSAMNLDGLRVGFGGGWPGIAEDSPIRAWLVDPDLAGGSDIASMKCVDNDQVAEKLYRRSLTGINFYRREANDGDTAGGVACGPREIEMAACGLWFTRDPRPESDELFPGLPAFGSPAEATEHVRWALKHPREREKAAAAAREGVAGRTFGAAARRLLQRVSR